jgi:peptide/nickel transport system ATP-binding protein
MYAGRIVECGPTGALTDAPAHPYTMGLMNASPDLDRAGDPLVPIDGAPPDLSDPPRGCRFAPRCPFALPACREADPPAVAVGEGHRAACLRAAEAPALRELARKTNVKAATWSR